MTDERIYEIAQDVCDYADAHGIPRDKDVDEIVADIEFALEYECLDELNYLFEYIDHEDELWDEVVEIWWAI